MDQKQVGSQIYYGGIGAPDGFGHGHYNGDTGYNRPPIGGDSVVNALGWTAIMGAARKPNIDVGGYPQ
jgi:hypothetical protein